MPRNLASRRPQISPKAPALSHILLGLAEQGLARRCFISLWLHVRTGHNYPVVIESGGSSGLSKAQGTVLLL